MNFKRPSAPFGIPFANIAYYNITKQFNLPQSPQISPLHAQTSQPITNPSTLTKNPITSQPTTTSSSQGRLTSQPSKTIPATSQLSLLSH